jgi:hypothetical protein
MRGETELKFRLVGCTVESSSRKSRQGPTLPDQRKQKQLKKEGTVSYINSFHFISIIQNLILLSDHVYIENNEGGPELKLRPPTQECWRTKLMGHQQSTDHSQERQCA